MDYSVGDTQVIGYSNTKLDQIMTSFHNQKYAEVIIKASYGSLTHNSFLCISLFQQVSKRDIYKILHKDNKICYVLVILC